VVGPLLEHHRRMARYTSVPLEMAAAPSPESSRKSQSSIPIARHTCSARGCRDCVVYIQILAVTADDGEPQGPVLVMAERYARERRLTSSNHVPFRSHQVDPVTQRGDVQTAMGIVHHYRVPTSTTVL
jgi:hypothetical protein